jgi:hypothetical protein
VETKYSLQDNVWRWPAAWQAILEDFKANRVTEVERKKILIPTWVKSTPRQPAETPEWSRR